MPRLHAVLHQQQSTPSCSSNCACPACTQAAAHDNENNKTYRPLDLHPPKPFPEITGGATGFSEAKRLAGGRTRIITNGAICDTRYHVCDTFSWIDW